MGDTTDWEVLGVPLKIVATQDPGNRQNNLWESFAVDIAENADLIIRVATEYLTPLVQPHLTPGEAARLIDLLVRVTISYFLAPSDRVDLADPASAAAFVRPILAALTPTHT